MTDCGRSGSREVDRGDAAVQCSAVLYGYRSDQIGEMKRGWMIIDLCALPLFH